LLQVKTNKQKKTKKERKKSHANGRKKSPSTFTKSIVRGDSVEATLNSIFTVLSWALISIISLSGFPPTVTPVARSGKHFATLNTITFFD
jgi:hypothetical protein